MTLGMRRPLLVLVATATLVWSGAPGFAQNADGWVVSTPTAEGIDEAVLTNLAARVRAGEHGAIDSLLVARHGRVAFEEYFRGYGADGLHRMYSVTKSVTSLLVGIAIDQGLTGDPSTPLAELFPQLATDADPLKRDIKLQHVLSMTAGFEWEEHAYSYQDPRNPVSSMAGSSDWIDFVLERPMAAEPGGSYSYNSGLTVLLSGILQHSALVPAERFAAERLFGPLGIERWSWESAPGGLTNTGWGLFLRPRDAAKVGQLVLEKGSWDGQEIVSPAWVERSTSPLVDVSATYGYGYQWWVLKPNPPSREVEVRFGWGYGGQFIFVVPALELLVVTTSSNYDSPQESDPIRFMANVILPAVAP